MNLRRSAAVVRHDDAVCFMLRRDSHRHAALTLARSVIASVLSRAPSVCRRKLQTHANTRMFKSQHDVLAWLVTSACEGVHECHGITLDGTSTRMPMSSPIPVPGTM
jgi:hypothetical protein